MNVRCPYCRNSFNLGQEYMVEAVNEMREKRQKYHGVECVNCRKVIKVPLKQMQRFVPKDTGAATDEEE